jgi:hypothetical protein
MSTGEALTRFFQRDSTKANNLTLYPHREEEFWLWVSSWALFISTPSDLGYDDTGYSLPPLEVRYHKVSIKPSEVVTERDGQIKLFREASVSLSDAAKEKSESITVRVNKAAEIVASDPDAHFILWHDREAERHEINRTIPGVVDIFGTQDYEIREQRVIDFTKGKIKYLATKKELSGYGCNFQHHCHRAIFVGIDYQFSDFIQSIHRIYRFLQKEQVIIDIIYTDGEEEVLRVLLEKWERHNELQAQMQKIIKTYGMHSMSALERLKRSIGVERVEVKGAFFTAVNNDCVEEMERVNDNTFHLIHTSIPFSNHYEYTASYNCFGNNQDTKRFFKQMDFLTPHLLRTLKPGRVFACHVKDRVLFGNATGTGFSTVEPFHALCIAHYMNHGFEYFGMITVLNDVVRENNQTYRLGWSEQCKDGTKWASAARSIFCYFVKSRLIHQRHTPTNRYRKPNRNIPAHNGR